MFCADFWWVSIIAAAVFVAFVVIVAIILKRKRTKGETKDRILWSFFFPEECKIS